MTTLAVRPDASFVCGAFPEKVARETRIVVHTEVLVALEMAVARSTRDGDAVNFFVDVILVRKLDAFLADRR